MKLKNPLLDQNQNLVEQPVASVLTDRRRAEMFHCKPKTSGGEEWVLRCSGSDQSPEPRSRFCGTARRPVRAALRPPASSRVRAAVRAGSQLGSLEEHLQTDETVTGSPTAPEPGQDASYLDVVLQDFDIGLLEDLAQLLNQNQDGDQNQHQNPSRTTALVLSYL
ncbi:hypothetical protein CCH79_00017430 [Gambusia affinis]|uniref:Uncharacterized protein n=1 Tax=Gambusia affinis TaxID=33528 RepID=A0A315VFK1_GAMAF|nr:hypothetical protein CCH79_00017430 [Gambusia affinis]